MKLVRVRAVSRQWSENIRFLYFIVVLPLIYEYFAAETCRINSTSGCPLRVETNDSPRRDGEHSGASSGCSDCRTISNSMIDFITPFIALLRRPYWTISMRFGRAASRSRSMVWCIPFSRNMISTRNRIEPSELRLSREEIVKPSKMDCIRWTTSCAEGRSPGLFEIIESKREWSVGKSTATVLSHWSGNMWLRSLLKTIMRSIPVYIG